MAYGNINYMGPELTRARGMGGVYGGSAMDPEQEARKAQLQQIKDYMRDMTHITPTGELVTYAPDPNGAQIRRLSKELKGDGVDHQAVTANNAMALDIWKHLNPQR